jgi:predicted DNA-binding transcriptional regulator YafY
MAKNNDLKSNEAKRQKADEEQEGLTLNKTTDLEQLKQVALDDDKNNQPNLNKVSTLERGRIILEVLKKHSNKDKTLKNTDIQSHLKRDYGISVDRHTLLRNLKELKEFDNKINYSETWRKKDGKEEPMYSDYFYDQDQQFTESEVRALIDGLLSSKYIPYTECESLIKKIETLSGDYIKSSYALPQNRPGNTKIFDNIKVILSAISNGKKIMFNYIYYGTDLKPHVRLKITQEDDKINKKKRNYVASPYEIIIASGIYYLICSHDYSDEMYHYRLDYMLNVEELKYNRRDVTEINGHSEGLNLKMYMMQRPYMMSGNEVARVIFRADSNIVGHVLDQFGFHHKDGAIYTNKTEDTVDVSVQVNFDAMLYWVLQFGQYIEVLQPQPFREIVINAVTEMYKKYNPDR